MAQEHKIFLVLVRPNERIEADLLLPKSDQFSIQFEDESHSNTQPPKKVLHVPWFIGAITLIQIGAFIYTSISGSDPYDIRLAFDPDTKSEPWRLITYMLLHADTQHLWGNLIIQLAFGLIEVHHGALHTGIIYFAGVLGGKLREW